MSRQEIAAPERFQSLADRAYEELRDSIITLKIAPGAPLDEDRLMRELGVGRTPIREALKRLALEDLVQVYPRRGTFTAEINITDLADIADVRTVLEGHAAYRAAERLGPDDERHLEQLLEQLNSPDLLSNSSKLMDLDSRVHRFVYGAAHNRYLEESLTVYFNLSVRIWHLALNRLPTPYDVSEHIELLRAIKARDPERARDALTQHIRSFEESIHSALRKQSPERAGGSPR